MPPRKTIKLKLYLLNYYEYYIQLFIIIRHLIEDLDTIYLT